MVAQKTNVIEEALQLLYQHRFVFQATDAALWTTLADHFPVWTQVIEVAKCWVFMTKTQQEQLMNVLLVTAAQDVDYAVTIDDDTVAMSGTWSRPPRASVDAAARQRRAPRPARPSRASSPLFGPSFARP